MAFAIPSRIKTLNVLETLAIGTAGGWMTRESLLAVVFLAAVRVFALWFWAVMGIATVGELLRIVWSEDRIVAGPTGIILYTSLGPFRKKIEIPRDKVRAIIPSARGSALVVKTTSATIVLTQHGSAWEREEVASTLRSELGLSPQSS
jgi:hypothetical protein